MKTLIKILVGIVIFLVVLVVLFIVYISLRPDNKAVVTVLNSSDQQVSILSITLSGQTNTFKNIPIGGKVSSQFKVFSDDHYIISGKMADSSKFGGDFGYVTSGMDFWDSFSIKPSGKIEFQRDRVD